MGLNETMHVKGMKYVKSYSPINSETGKPLTSKRFFCAECGSMLWLHDPTWDEWVYPFASSIDVPLPPAPETLVVLRSSCPKHVPLPENAVVEELYGEESIED